ncbi:MAG: class I SAM-dependent methyltransferase, partial [Sphingobacteriales bacterium]
VEATDTSAEMLRHAPMLPNIRYTLALANQQPFPDASFDLITVCSGVHWFDIDSFLAEAGRLLKAGASLVLYDNFFLAEMDEVPEFRDWHTQVYLQRYPAPARNNQYDWSAAHMRLKGFSIEEEEPFTNAVTFTKAELILYFTTQSNVSFAVEEGGKQYADIEAWLDVALEPFFDHDEHKRSFTYGNSIQYLRNTD